jgi:hypothetical protein
MIYGPATFYKRNKLIEINGYDETYYFIEDRTTFFKWLIAGNKIYYLPKKTIKYRVNSNSITKINHDNNSVISDFTIKFGTVIFENFYKYFSIKEKIYYHIRYSYLNFFKRRNKMNFFIKIFRRSWYVLVQFGDKYNQNSLDRIYKEFIKNEL